MAITIVKALIFCIGIGISLFQLYTGALGTFDAYLQRTIHLMSLTALGYLAFPTKKSWPKEKNAALDIPLALLCLCIGAYLTMNHERLVTREWYWGPVTYMDITLGVVTIALVLEAARRVVGPALPIIAMIFMAYALFGGYLPYPFTIKAPPPLVFIDHMFLTTQAIFGIPTGVSATFVFLFILFGAFLDKTGAAKFIIDFSLGLVGRATGGPAKVSILASALFGTVSGHSVANVYGTGTFTIPLMKRMGYKADFAGAVEAAASSGGQIMPPIMGAAAFIMAEILGVSYLSVVKAALLPAILYFVALFVSCHIEALKCGLRGMSKAEVPSLTETIKGGAHFFIPLVILVVVLIQGFTPFRAAFIAIVTLVVVANFRKSSRMSLRDYGEVLVQGARNSIVIAVSCGCAGIVVGVMDVTGLGIKFVTIVTELSMGILPLALVLVMFACLILGMGVPTAPAYIVAAMIAAPTLVSFRVDPMAAHMFVFYSCLLSALTPPVALAAYAGAAISGGSVMRTAVNASKLGFVKFLVPYMFVYNAAFLMMGGSVFVAWSFFTGVVGTVAICVAMEGYLLGKITWLQRSLFAIAGAFTLVPEVKTDVVGLVLFAVLCLRHWKATRNEASVRQGSLNDVSVAINDHD